MAQRWLGHLHRQRPGACRESSSIDRSYGVDLADVDGDGDMDAFVANYSSEANKVWLNNGSGVFTDSGQNLGSWKSTDVDFTDIDGDGDVDAYVSNQNQGDKVWLNDGSGVFTDSSLSLGSYDSYGADLGDIDGDGAIDAVVAGEHYWSYNRAWLNKTEQKVLGYTEGDGAEAITSLIRLTDDGANLESAAVKISAGYVNGEDVLGFTDTDKHHRHMERRHRHADAHRFGFGGQLPRRR